MADTRTIDRFLMAVMKIGGSIVAGDYCRDSGLVFIQAFQPCVTVVCELEKNF
jgi:hypothetical protein